MSAISSLADNPFRIGDRNSPKTGLNVNDKDNHRYGNDPEEEYAEIADRPCLNVMIDRPDILWQRSNDTGKDDEGNTIPHSLGRNLLAKPHEKDSTCSQGNRNDQYVDWIWVEYCCLQADGHADGLKECQHHSQITGNLRRLLMPFLAFLGPLFQRRNHYIEQLDDNRCIDVGGNAHRKDGELAESSTGKQIQQAEEAPVIEELLYRGRIHSRHRDMRSHPEDGKHDQCEDDLLPQLRNLEDIRKG